MSWWLLYPLLLGGSLILGHGLVLWLRHHQRVSYERWTVTTAARMARERELYERALALHPGYPTDDAELAAARAQWQEWIADQP